MWKNVHSNGCHRRISEFLGHSSSFFPKQKTSVVLIFIRTDEIIVIYLITLLRREKITTKTKM